MANEKKPSEVERELSDAELKQQQDLARGIYVL